MDRVKGSTPPRVGHTRRQQGNPSGNVPSSVGKGPRPGGRKPSGAPVSKSPAVKARTKTGKASQQTLESF